MIPVSGSGLRAQAAVVCQYWGKHHSKSQHGEGNTQTQAPLGEILKVAGLGRAQLGRCQDREMTVGGSPLPSSGR